MQNIAFIGVGVMGRSMVRNLMKNGYQVSIYTRTKRKVLDVIEDGALWCDSIAECVQNKDAVITMVGFPKDVKEVYFGEHGIIQHAKPGAYLIDMTTTSPKLSQRIYQESLCKRFVCFRCSSIWWRCGSEKCYISHYGWRRRSCL